MESMILSEYNLKMIDFVNRISQIKDEAENANCAFGIVLSERDANDNIALSNANMRNKLADVMVNAELYARDNVGDASSLIKKIIYKKSGTSVLDAPSDVGLIHQYASECAVSLDDYLHPENSKEAAEIIMSDFYRDNEQVLVDTCLRGEDVAASYLASRMKLESKRFDNFAKFGVISVSKECQNIRLFTSNVSSASYKGTFRGLDDASSMAERYNIKPPEMNKELLLSSMEGILSDIQREYHVGSSTLPLYPSLNDHIFVNMISVENGGKCYILNTVPKRTSDATYKARLKAFMKLQDILKEAYPEINFNYISKVFPKDNIAMQVLGEGLFADVESMLEKSMSPKNTDVKSQKFNRPIPEIVSGDNSFEGLEF